MKFYNSGIKRLFKKNHLNTERNTVEIEQLKKNEALDDATVAGITSFPGFGTVAGKALQTNAVPPFAERAGYAFRRKLLQVLFGIWLQDAPKIAQRGLLSHPKEGKDAYKTKKKSCSSTGIVLILLIASSRIQEAEVEVAQKAKPI